jgi:hypothetical protein
MSPPFATLKSKGGGAAVTVNLNGAVLVTVLATALTVIVELPAGVVP